MTDDRDIDGKEWGAAIDTIEAALQRAFSGQEGARRLAAVSAAPPAAETQSLRQAMVAAIAEIALAERSGAPLDDWLKTLADHLKEVSPSLDAVTLERVLSLAGRIAADPPRSLGAHAGIASKTVRNLTG